MEAEVAAAEEAARSAEAEARRKIRDQKTTERKEKVQEKIDELKAKWNTYGSILANAFKSRRQRSLMPKLLTPPALKSVAGRTSSEAS